MHIAAILLLCVSIAPAALSAEPAIPPDISGQALEILKRSIGFKTAIGEAQVPAYAEYLAGVLKAGGFAPGDITITPRGETATLVAYYRGMNSSAKPIVIASHMDVVTALREDWARDPFVAVVENGYVFGC